MKHFLIKYGVTAARTNSTQAVRVDFSAPVITDGEWPNKAKCLEGTKVLLRAGGLTNVLPKGVFPGGALGETYYVIDSVNITEIQEISAEAHEFYYDRGL